MKNLSVRHWMAIHLQQAVWHLSPKPSGKVRTGVINLWIICKRAAVGEDNLSLRVRRKVKPQERSRGMPCLRSDRKSSPEKRKPEVGGTVGASWGQASRRSADLACSATHYWAVTWAKKWEVSFGYNSGAFITILGKASYSRIVVTEARLPEVAG